MFSVLFCILFMIFTPSPLGLYQESGWLFSNKKSARSITLSPSKVQTALFMCTISQLFTPSFTCCTIPLTLSGDTSVILKDQLYFDYPNSGLAVFFLAWKIRVSSVVPEHETFLFLQIFSLRYIRNWTFPQQQNHDKYSVSIEQKENQSRVCLASFACELMNTDHKWLSARSSYLSLRKELTLQEKMRLQERGKLED